MKTIKFTAFLFYHYYSTGATKDIPYVSTLCAMAMIIFIHLMQLLILLHKVDIISIKLTDSKTNGFIITALVFLPIFLLLSLIIKKEKIKSLSYSMQKIKRGNAYLIIYIILSTTLLFALAVFYQKG